MNERTVQEPFKVLVVDDDADLLDLIKDGLELLGGFTVIAARDGAEGLERFFESYPHCCVVDVRMPEIDGFQLVRALRGDPESASVPIILLTALAEDRHQFAGFASGADQYLVKPVSPQELVQAVQRAVLVTEAERQAQFQTLLDLGEEAETRWPTAPALGEDARETR